MTRGGKRRRDEERGRDEPRSGTVEVTAADGATLADVEAWCARMREAGAPDPAVMYADTGAGPSRVILLVGYPAASFGPAVPPPPGKETQRMEDEPEPR